MFASTASVARPRKVCQFPLFIILSLKRDWFSYPWSNWWGRGEWVCHDTVASDSFYEPQLSEVCGLWPSAKLIQPASMEASTVSTHSDGDGVRVF